MASASWRPQVSKAAGPLYLAIADAIAADMRAGRLAAGARLPPQRALADALGIDFTTVTRAYAEAGRRGLVEGRAGRGTYVRGARPAAATPSAGGLVDLSMNLPPRADDPALAARLWHGIGGLGEEGGLELLLRYQEPGGTERDRAAGAAWLAPRLGPLPTERVLVCPGAQGALAALIGMLAGPGDTVCTEMLTYPGLRALAAHLRIRLSGVAIDDRGIVPDAFEAVCREARPKALYLNPTLHNPTTATLPLERRRAVVEIAGRHGVPIVEDDAYGALPAAPVPPLAALAPDRVYHVAGLAKCLSPALRIAYLAVPDARAAQRAAAALRATAAMASPLSAAIATRWIEDGTAGSALAAIRREASARQGIAASILPPELAASDPEGFHLWLGLPPGWSRGELTLRLRTAGIAVVASDAFALNAPPEAVRLGLGAADGREVLRRGLELVADLLAEGPAASSTIV